MNLLNLEYFLVAAEELNFTKAAKRLYITQQSLSNHIAKLESYFGADLFDRTPPMTLTNAGLCLVRHAKRLMQSTDELEREMQDIKDFKSSELFIGITRARAAVYLPAILPKFCQDYPKIKLHLVEENSFALEQLLLAGKVDLILGRFPEDALGIVSETVWMERYLLIVPDCIINQYIPEKKEAILSEDYQVSLKDFEQCPFLASRKVSLVGQVFRDFCAQSNMSPEIVLESHSINIVIALCLEGMGILVCPNVFLNQYYEKIQRMGKGKIHIFSLPYSDRIAASRLESKYFPHSACKFLDAIRKVSQEISFIPSRDGL